MSKINYVIGDATCPQGKGNKVIAHICNDIGAWGAGFVIAISKKWKSPERVYRKAKPEERVLGNVQFVIVETELPQTYVCNMIAQHGIMDTKIPGVNDDGTFGNLPPIRYGALKDCLLLVNQFCVLIGASLHLPRIGSGLAGGDWKTIEALIEECTTVPVTVYDLPQKI